MSGLTPLTLMVTSAGCPGASTCIRYLKGIAERPIKIVAIDAEKESIGRFFADEFYQVPLADSPDYIDKVLEYAKESKTQCIVVSSSYEVQALSPHKQRFEAEGIKVLASNPEGLDIANNKKALYQYFENHPDVKVPAFKVVNTLNEFTQACQDMGYPDKNLCFKPPVSKGSRGFRFLAAGIDRADLLLNYKPDSKIISLDEMQSIFKDKNDFPELLLMEAVEGEEIDSMAIAHQHEVLLITHKTREADRGGVITRGEHCERPELDLAIQAIFKEVDLAHNIGIQFKGGYLIEINPRLSTFIYDKDWVEPYFAVKLALGEWTPEEVKVKQKDVPKDLRMLRYFDQHFYSG